MRALLRVGLWADKALFSEEFVGLTKEGGKKEWRSGGRWGLRYRDPMQCR